MRCSYLILTQLQIGLCLRHRLNQSLKNFQRKLCYKILNLLEALGLIYLHDYLLADLTDLLCRMIDGFQKLEVHLIIWIATLRLLNTLT